MCSVLSVLPSASLRGSDTRPISEGQTAAYRLTLRLSPVRSLCVRLLPDDQPFVYRTRS